MGKFILRKIWKICRNTPLDRWGNVWVECVCVFYVVLEWVMWSDRLTIDNTAFCFNLMNSSGHLKTQNIMSHFTSKPHMNTCPFYSLTYTNTDTYMLTCIHTRASAYFSFVSASLYISAIRHHYLLSQSHVAHFKFLFFQSQSTDLF